jgi:hypothetical protein
MRKIWTIAVAAALAIPASFAIATPGDNPGRGNGEKPEVGRGVGVKPESPGKGRKPHVCPKPGKRSVKYIVRGVLARDATATELVVDVTRVNRHAKLALAGPTAVGAGAYSVPMLTVKLDACTKITNNGRRPSKRTWEALDQGDRVVIGWQAKKGTAYVDLGAAVRVVDTGRAR